MQLYCISFVFIRFICILVCCRGHSHHDHYQNRTEHKFVSIHITHSDYTNIAWEKKEEKKNNFKIHNTQLLSISSSLYLFSNAAGKTGHL